MSEDGGGEYEWRITFPIAAGDLEPLVVHSELKGSGATMDVTTETDGACFVLRTNV